MGPTRKLSLAVEKKMLDYIQDRHDRGDPLMKVDFKREVDDYLTFKNLLHNFGGSLPSEYILCVYQYVYGFGVDSHIEVENYLLLITFRLRMDADIP